MNEPAGLVIDEMEQILKEMEEAHLLKGWHMWIGYMSRFEITDILRHAA